MDRPDAIYAKIIVLDKFLQDCAPFAIRDDFTEIIDYLAKLEELNKREE